MTQKQKDEIKNIARKMLNAERAVVHNQESGHEKAVYKYQELADQEQQNLLDYLETI